MRYFHHIWHIDIWALRTQKKVKLVLIDFKLTLIDTKVCTSFSHVVKFGDSVPNGQKLQSILQCFKCFKLWFYIYLKLLF